MAPVTTEARVGLGLAENARDCKSRLKITKVNRDGIVFVLIQTLVTRASKIGYKEIELKCSVISDVNESEVRHPSHLCASCDEDVVKQICESVNATDKVFISLHVEVSITNYKKHS